MTRASPVLTPKVFIATGCTAVGVYRPVGFVHFPLIDDYGVGA